VKKFLATLVLACFAFTFTLGSIGCSGDKSVTKTKEEKSKEETKPPKEKENK